MPYRTQPAAPAPFQVPSRFAFRSVRVRAGATRFELSAVDAELSVAVGVLLLCFGGLLWLLPWHMAVLALALIAAFMLCARVALVVTPDEAWLEHRVFAVRWSRARLGRMPKIESGLVWDWSELAIYPAEPELQAPLHDGERAVLLNWSDDKPGREADAAFLAELAREAIARLHAM